MHLPTYALATQELRLLCFWISVAKGIGQIIEGLRAGRLLQDQNDEDSIQLSSAGLVLAVSTTLVKR